MSYTVEELAAAGYSHYIDEDGGSYWDEADALEYAQDMIKWCMDHGYDLARAAEEVGGYMFMEE